jgi:hypothetical protein
LVHVGSAIEQYPELAGEQGGLWPPGQLHVVNAPFWATQSAFVVHSYENVPALSLSHGMPSAARQ